MKGNGDWIGCINGLVCLYDLHKNFGEFGFVIWNPATKQCLKIALGLVLIQFPMIIKL